MIMICNQDLDPNHIVDYAPKDISENVSIQKWKGDNGGEGCLYS